jgi:hypothetical protein
MFTQFLGTAATVYGVPGDLKSLRRARRAGTSAQASWCCWLDASGPPAAASSGLSAWTLLARCHDKKRNQP